MFKRRGTSSMKFQFGCIIHSVEIQCPLSVERKMSIKWVRGPHHCETDAVVNCLLGDKKMSRFEWGAVKPLMMPATLYREKNGKFQPKRCKLSVKQYYDGKKTTVGKIVIDLGQCAREGGQDFVQKYTADLQRCPSKAKIVYSMYSRLVSSNTKNSVTGGPGHLSVLKDEEGTKSQMESLVESEFDQSKYESKLEGSEAPDRSRVGESVLKGGKKDLPKLLQHIRDSDLPQSRRQMLATYKYSFYGCDLVDWLLRQDYVNVVGEAVTVGQALVDSKLIRCPTCCDDEKMQFGNDGALYQLASVPDDKGGLKQDLEELNVRDILDTPQYAVELRRFLEKNLCLESFLFLEAAHAFENSSAPQELQRARAGEIYKNYILETGEYAVNVDSLTREDIERVLEGSSKSGGPGVPSDLFANAVKMIVEMLQRDVFKRFVADPAYEKMIASNALNANVIGAESRHRASYRAIPLEDDYLWMDQLTEKMLKEKDLIADRRVKLKKYPKCAPGSAVVDWLLYQQQAKVRPGAVALAQRMLDAGVIRSAVDKSETEFMDEPNAFFEIGGPLALPEGITAESNVERLDPKQFYCGKLLVKGVRYSVVVGVLQKGSHYLGLYRPNGCGLPFILPPSPSPSPSPSTSSSSSSPPNSGQPSANQPYLIVNLNLKGAQLKVVRQQEKDDAAEKVIPITYIHLYLQEASNADARRVFVFRFDASTGADAWMEAMLRVPDVKLHDPNKPKDASKEENSKSKLSTPSFSSSAPSYSPSPSPSAQPTTTSISNANTLVTNNNNNNINNNNGNSLAEKLVSAEKSNNSSSSSSSSSGSSSSSSSSNVSINNTNNSNSAEESALKQQKGGEERKKPMNIVITKAH